VKNCDELKGVSVWDVPDSEFAYSDDLSTTDDESTKEKFDRSTRPLFGNRGKPKAGGTTPQSAKSASSTSS
jgi:hypothetical protein